MDLQRGMRDQLEKYVDLRQSVDIQMNTSGSAVYDYCCFGVDGAGRLSDDRYMVFYNQPQSPDREITYAASGSGAQFVVNLEQLPDAIQKLVFTVSIDGNGTMSDITGHTAAIRQNGRTVLELRLSGADFHREKAIIAIELYKKGVWRFGAVASGFNGGLGDLLRAYGGEELTEAEPAVQKVSLEKRLEREAPQLVSLAKPLRVELEKRNLLDCVARVALVLDISGSMTQRYKNGTVQEIVNKTLPLAVQFDDDGELDFWYYGTTPKRMPSVNLRNYGQAVPEDWRRLMREVGGQNNEPKVRRLIIDEYQFSRVPAYVLFITDGGVCSESKIKKLLTEASRFPIFWQFVGVGGSNSGYGVLDRLDTMGGRYVDNANFFALDDFKAVGSSELYSRLLNEFPQWLCEIRRRGMI